MCLDDLNGSRYCLPKNLCDKHIWNKSKHKLVAEIHIPNSSFILKQNLFQKNLLQNFYIQIKMNMNLFINQANHSKLFKEVHSIRKSIKFKKYQHNGYDYILIFISLLTERLLLYYYYFFIDFMAKPLQPNHPKIKQKNILIIFPKIPYQIYFNNINSV